MKFIGSGTLLSTSQILVSYNDINSNNQGVLLDNLNNSIVSLVSTSGTNFATFIITSITDYTTYVSLNINITYTTGTWNLSSPDSVVLNFSLNGTSGVRGTSGSSGSSSTAGTSGTAATGGTSGSSSTAGTSGTTGTSGSSATAGTSGTSGSSSTAGTVYKVTSVSSAYTILGTDDYVIYTGSAAVNITLPTAVGSTKVYTIKNRGTGEITLKTTSSQTIDGAATRNIVVSTGMASVKSDGANWIVIATM